VCKSFKFLDDGKSVIYGISVYIQAKLLIIYINNGGSVLWRSRGARGD
jgi:hypothetical protein